MIKQQMLCPSVLCTLMDAALVQAPQRQQLDTSQVSRRRLPVSLVPLSCSVMDPSLQRRGHMYHVGLRRNLPVFTSAPFSI